MVINTKLSSAFLLFFLLFLYVITFSLVVAGEDPEELQLCKSQCRAQHPFSHRQKRECEQKCEDYYRQKQGGEGEGEEGGSGSDRSRILVSSDSNSDPEKELQQCQKQCELQKEQQKEQCRRQCQETYEQRQHGEEGGEEEGEEKDNQGMQQEQRQGQGQEEQNPFVFEDQHYIISQEFDVGRVRILQKFHERSPLLGALENHRFISIEAHPQTFVLPGHLDAEILLFVASGRGTLSLVSQGKRESFNIKQGDVVRIRSGTTLYFINGGKSKKLRIAKLLQSVSLPGEFQAYYGSAGQKPPSFYRAFSPELLATALKADRDKVQSVISQQNKGVIVKASEQQIQAMSQSQEAEDPSLRRSKRVFNLLSKEPSISNPYGRLHEVDANEFKQLQDMDVAVSYANITKGAIQGPFFNSRSTKIVMVVKGEGYIEMACPHVAQQQQQQHQQQAQRQQPIQHYRRITSPLKRGTLFVVPTGHPVIIVAGRDRNLEIACFDINAENNRRETLAGDKSTVNALENEAKELAFGIQAREVDEAFGKQKEWFFLPGPRGGRAHA